MNMWFKVHINTLKYPSAWNEPKVRSILFNVIIYSYILSVPRQVIMVVDEAAAIFQALKGQSLIVPSIEPIYGHWVQGISPLYEKLVHTVNQEIDEVVKDRETCKKLQSMDIALFAA